MINKYLAALGDETITGVASKEEDLGKLISTAFTLATVVGAFFVLYQLVLGALNWINSAGDKEKITKAQKQMTNALIGLVLLIMVWVLFFTIAGDILGIFKKDSGGAFRIEIPSLFGN